MTQGERKAATDVDIGTPAVLARNARAPFGTTPGSRLPVVVLVAQEHDGNELRLVAVVGRYGKHRTTVDLPQNPTAEQLHCAYARAGTLLGKKALDWA